jgi:hypothetical protein
MKAPEPISLGAIREAQGRLTDTVVRTPPHSLPGRRLRSIIRLVLSMVLELHSSFQECGSWRVNCWMAH